VRDVHCSVDHRNSARPHARGPAKVTGLAGSAMEWTDEAVVLSARPHGETAVLAEMLTRAHGRYAGLVHGGRSRRLRPVLQTGNHVDVTWKARLADQLGFFSVEPRRGFAAEIMQDGAALAGLTS